MPTVSSLTSFVPELLCPAGSLKNMRYAFAYGADAVYAGQPRYSLRVRNNEFDLDTLQIGINEAHALNKSFMWYQILPRITLRLNRIYVILSR